MKLTGEYIEKALDVMKDCGFSGVKVDLDMPYDDIDYMELILDNNIIVADFYDIENDLVWRIEQGYVSDLVIELKKYELYGVEIKE